MVLVERLRQHVFVKIEALAACRFEFRIRTYQSSAALDVNPVGQLNDIFRQFVEQLYLGYMRGKTGPNYVCKEDVRSADALPA